MKFVSKDGLRYYHQKKVLPAIKSHVNRINITGQTLDVNTLTLSDGSSNKAEYIEKTNGGAANITNIPVTNLPFVLVVELIRWASASDYITKQTFYTSTSTYSRICTSGSWSNWAQLIFTDTKYTHPTTSGNKHIPSGGSSGQILRWSSDGTATWGSDSDTKNTAGSTNSSSKLFLIGATSQAANPQTFSHDTAYVGTDGHLYSDSKQVVNLSGSQALTNKTYNGYTLAAACAKSVTDSSSASAIGTGSSLVTERDVYYGLPTINGAHTYTSNTNIYAPTSVGTSGYILKSGGSGAPSWVSQSSLSVGSATKATQDGNGKVISSTYLPLSGGTVSGAVTVNAPITFGDNDDFGIYVSRDNYACIGNSDKKFYRSYITKMYGSIIGSVDKPFKQAYITTAYFGAHNIYSSLNAFILEGNGKYSTGGLKIVNYTPENGIAENYSEVTPLEDNASNLGQYHTRWSVVCAATGTINTSDRNLKKEIKPLTDLHKKFFLMLQPVSFIFTDGQSGRTHIGFISQDVEDIMNSLGMSSLDFAGFCKDQKTKEITNENGDKVRVPDLDEDGNPKYIYSLRYSEFIAINTFMIQELYHEVEDLKNIVSKRSDDE